MADAPDAERRGHASLAPQTQVQAELITIPPEGSDNEVEVHTVATVFKGGFGVFGLAPAEVARASRSAKIGASLVGGGSGATLPRRRRCRGLPHADVDVEMPGTSLALASRVGSPASACVVGSAALPSALAVTPLASPGWDGGDRSGDASASAAGDSRGEALHSEPGPRNAAERGRDGRLLREPRRCTAPSDAL